MIVYLEGRLHEVRPLQAVVLAGGVGYAVNIPLRVSEKLPPRGGDVSLHIRQVFREDASDLYGFTEAAERDFFDLLTGVSGIGPKMALTLLSRVDPASLTAGIASGDTGMLSKCPGIGKKTAERIVVDLRDKVSSLGTPGPLAPAGASPSAEPREEQAVAALATLGFKMPDARKAVAKAARNAGPGASTEELVKTALRQGV